MERFDFDVQAIILLKKNILAARESRDWTRSFVAGIIGIKESTLRRIEENEKFYPPLIILLRLMRLYGISFYSKDSAIVDVYDLFCV